MKINVLKQTDYEQINCLEKRERKKANNFFLLPIFANASLLALKGAQYLARPHIKNLKKQKRNKKSAQYSINQVADIFN